MNRNKRKGKPHNCFICGKYGSITVQHHVRPIKHADSDISIYGVYKTNLVWLCPNHYTLVHKWEKCTNNLARLTLSSECLTNDNEKNQFFKVIEATDNGKIDQSRGFNPFFDSEEYAALSYLWSTE